MFCTYMADTNNRIQTAFQAILSNGYSLKVTDAFAKMTSPVPIAFAKISDLHTKNRVAHSLKKASGSMKRHPRVDQVALLCDLKLMLQA